MKDGYARIDGLLDVGTVSALRRAVEVAPAAVRGHLIHLALPGDGEAVPAGGWQGRLLPRFDGERVDLPLSLVAPH